MVKSFNNSWSRVVHLQLLVWPGRLTQKMKWNKRERRLMLKRLSLCHKFTSFLSVVVLTMSNSDECRSSIASLEEMLTTSTGIPYTDKLLYHHRGYTPANVAESGQQYGGNYPCGNCGIHASMFDDMAYCLRRPVLTFTDKRDIFFRVVYGNNKDCK